jgi:hypothetical protein
MDELIKQYFQEPTQENFDLMCSWPANAEQVEALLEETFKYAAGNPARAQAFAEHACASIDTKKPYSALFRETLAPDIKKTKRLHRADGSVTVYVEGKPILDLDVNNKVTVR